MAQSSCLLVKLSSTLAHQINNSLPANPLNARLKRNVPELLRGSQWSGERTIDVPHLLQAGRLTAYSIVGAFGVVCSSQLSERQ